MDDKLDVKDEGEEQLPEEPSTSEETTEEVEEPKGEEVATEPEETKAETGESKKGYSQRVRELNEAKKAAEAKAAEAEERAQSLAEKLSGITAPMGNEDLNSPTYDPNVQDGDQITPERYQGDVAQAAKQIVEWELAQERAVNRIDKEANEAIAKYPELDPDNKEAFNKELSDAITAAVEKEAVTVTYDKSGRPIRTINTKANVKGLVDTLIKPYKAAVAREVGQATESIAKQASDSALRPTSVRKQEKAAEDKSLAELEEELGIVHS